MRLFNDIYSTSGIWRQAHEAREAKKQALQAIVEPQGWVLEPSESMGHVGVVFTKEDNGHNDEEKKQIQNIYVQLGRLTLPTAYAVK